MIKSGKEVYTILAANTALTALVGTKIYPLVIPEGTSLPCIVYERSFENTNTKDGIASSNSSINITVISLNYSNSIAISEAVYNALKGEALLTGGSETYAEGAFIQNLSFTYYSV